MNRSHLFQFYRAGYITICVAVAAVIFGIFLRIPGIIGDTSASFYHLVVLDAARPFAYRTLLPSTIHTVTRLIPEETRANIVQSARDNPAVVDLFNLLEWRLEFAIEFAIAVVLMFAFLLGFMWAIRYLATAIFKTNWFLIDLLPILALLGLPPFFTNTNYIYDIPSLFFFTIGLALMIRRKWGWYIPIYVLACLNKETTILLTLVFAIHFFPRSRMQRQQYAQLLFVQLAIWGIIRLLLMLIYRDALGTPATFTLDYNLRVFTAQIYTLPEVFTWLGIFLLLAYHWQSKPAFLRNSIWIVIPLLGLMIFFGIVGETRVLYEAYPIALLLIFHTVVSLLEFNISDISDPESRVSSAR